MDCHSICFKKETCTSFFPTIKNHQTSPYICKQCTYTTDNNKLYNNKHSQKNTNKSKLH